MKQSPEYGALGRHKQMQISREKEAKKSLQMIPHCELYPYKYNKEFGSILKINELFVAYVFMSQS